MLNVYEYENEGLDEVPDITPGTWLRLVDPSDEEIDRVSATCSVDRAHLEASLDFDEVSRAEVIDKTLCVIFNVPLKIPESDEDVYNVMPVSLTVTPQYAITSSLYDIPAFDDVLEQKRSQLDPSKPLVFVCHMLLLSAALFQRYLREVDFERSGMIAGLGRKTSNKDLLRLHELEASLVYLEQGLRSNKASFTLIDDKAELGKTQSERELIREVIIETNQGIEMASIYRELVSSTRDLFANTLNNTLNVVMKILTSLTIILAVPTIISGFYGMNVPTEGMPFGSMTAAFGIICGATALICAVVAWFLHKSDLL